MSSPEVGELHVNTSRLWTGGLATAIVAMLVILVGTLLMRGVFGIPVLAPEEAGYLGDVGTVLYALLAGAAALAAVGLMHVLLSRAPRGRFFFGWIAGLAAAVAAVAPFTQAAPVPSQLATAVINLSAGVVIAVLVNTSARSATRGLGAPGRRRILRKEGLMPEMHAENDGTPAKEIGRWD